ncbi:hypothetical protein PCASD_24662 [Puccinia coronata f. sp. avenae]|uniref:Uncharacterized protein n=1 Tax=Puccinia coronata f. sp. avenae TaxID=200324 RepID=A0A2N5TMC5_9BASI|nr:hypothetical protein PCASD_24662 [Puccinia coronata f. sp. avenae]
MYFANQLINLAIHHRFQSWLINIKIDLLKALGNNLASAPQCVSSLIQWKTQLGIHAESARQPSVCVSNFIDISGLPLERISPEFQLRPEMDRKVEIS